MNTNLLASVTMTCICGTDHTFAPGEGTGTCANEACGLGLVLSEEVSLEEGREAEMERDTPMGIEDDNPCDRDEEPYDIDSDDGYDIYAGGPESTYDDGDAGDYYGDE